MIRTIVAGLALALLLAVPVSAGRPAVVSFSLDQATSPVTFSVTRSTPDSEVWWITVACFAADGSPVAIGYVNELGNFILDDDRVVIWGMFDSLTGYTQPLNVAGASCIAHLTQTPWRVKRSDPSITF